MVRNYLLIFLLLLMPSFIQAKTTYIPHYKSYISIEDANGNVISDNSQKLSMSLSDPEKLFRISVAHEELTTDKVKEIKRAKAAAGWKAASAILSSVAALNDGSALSFQTRLSIASEEIALELADMYTNNALAEQVLSIEVQFENLSDHEMLLHDMERGLVWFVRPENGFVIKLNNPDGLQLRISDAENITSNVYYARLGAGNSVEKVEVTYETDAYILTVQKPATDSLYMTKNSPKSTIYWFYDKEEYIARKIDEEEYKRIRGSK